MNSTRNQMTLLLAATSIAAGYIYKRWGRRKQRLGGLNTLVGFSSKVIAAARALETQHGADALVIDPLAELLAGEEAMDRAKKMYARGGSKAGSTSEAPSTTTAMTTANGTGAADSGAAVAKPRRPVVRLIMRTLIFDDSVLSCAGVAARRVAKGLRDTWTAAGQEPCTQVVQLGAGMDTRAWRLALPPGVAWFEVDTSDVLAAKRRDMEGVGASFEPQQGSTGAGSPAFPLKAASYAGVAADLQVPGWSAALMEAGFSAAKKTIWVLEGLLYYLAQDTVPALFKEMADVSAPGSVMVASAVSRSVTDRVRRGSGSITQTWQWGAPGTVDEWPAYWAASGWTTTCIEHWMDLATEYGLTPQAPAATGSDRNGKGPDGQSGADGNGEPPANKQGGIVFAVKA